MSIKSKILHNYCNSYKKKYVNHLKTFWSLLKELKSLFVSFRDGLLTIMAWSKDRKFISSWSKMLMYKNKPNKWALIIDIWTTFLVSIKQTQSKCKKSRKNKSKKNNRMRTSMSESIWILNVKKCWKKYNVKTCKGF